MTFQANLSMVHLPQSHRSSLTPLIYRPRDTLPKEYTTTTVSMHLLIRQSLPLIIKVRRILVLLDCYSHTVHTANHPVLSNASYTSYLPHHYSQHRAHQSHSTPGIQPSSHPQAPPNLQSIGDIRSRWIALQTQSTTWAPDTIEPRDLSGESPLMAFVERSEGRYQCQVPVEDGGCGKENIKKDRMLAHIRKEHLHFRPLACGGRCGLIGWLVAPPCTTARRWLTCLLPAK